MAPFICYINFFFIIIIQLTMKLDKKEFQLGKYDLLFGKKACERIRKEVEAVISWDTIGRPKRLEPERILLQTLLLFQP